MQRQRSSQQHTERAANNKPAEPSSLMPTEGQRYHTHLPLTGMGTSHMATKVDQRHYGGLEWCGVEWSGVGTAKSPVPPMSPVGSITPKFKIHSNSTHTKC